MSIDNAGCISTYKGICINYKPDHTLPEEIKDQRLGQLYECENYIFDPEKDSKNLWKSEIENGKKLCFLCKNLEKK